MSPEAKGEGAQRHTTEVLVERELAEGPTLGELNPLLFSPEFHRPESIEALVNVARRTIQRVGGKQPTRMGQGSVITDRVEPRFVVQFELPNITEEQLALIEEMVIRVYGENARTRKRPGGEATKLSFYPQLDEEPQGLRRARAQRGGTLLGWYMGPVPGRLEASHVGVFVYKDVGTRPMAEYLQDVSPSQWFFEKELVRAGKRGQRTIPSKCLVEVREVSLYQTDLVELIVQISYLLEHGKLLENRRLLYEIYNDLNCLGLKKNPVYGLEEETAHINRACLLPLANPQVSRGIGLDAESILLTGIPGTGKTLIVEHLLREDAGVFIVPVDPLALATDLAENPEKRWLLPRISAIAERTGIPVVLHVDDIESIGGGDKQDSAVSLINSALLNLLAGVRERGFRLLASTNHPERISSQLLQPQRLGHIIYFGLPGPEVRRGILEVHATAASRELGKPLFDSEQTRSAIIETVVNRTVGWTPRYLAQIANAAKSRFLAGLAERKGKRTGMKEEDIDKVFGLEDWAHAFEEVNRRLDLQRLRDWDEAIQAFVHKHSASVGFHPSVPQQNPESVVEEIRREVAARMGSSPQDPIKPT